MQLLRRSLGTLCAATALCCAAARAAEPTPLPSPSAPPEIGHVVTSDRQDESLHSAARTTYVVTKSQMIARGYASVADALTSIPGVVIERYGGFGSAANVGIRGSSSAQVLVLLDGRPIGRAQNGTLDLGELSTSGVERIEIVEGGGATLYGAGAIGGVINILTTAKPHEPALVTAGAGSFNTSGLNIETRNLTFERALSENNYPYAGTTVPSGTRINADSASTTGRLRGDAMLGAVSVQGSFGLAQQHTGVPGPIALPFSSSSSSSLSVPTPDPSLSSSYQSSTTRQNTVDEDGRLTFALVGAHTTTTLDLTATRDTLLYYSSPGDPLACFTAAFTQPCQDINAESRMQLSLRQVASVASQHLVYGIDLAHGTARIDADDGNPPSAGFAQTAVYVQDAATLGHVDAYAGVRAERDGGQGGAIAPSLGFIAPLSPDLTLRSNFADGFRAPTAVDLYYPGFSNPNLLPERTQSFDVTATATRALGGVSLCYFTLAGNNLIIVNPNYDFSAPQSPSNEPVINAEHASIAGLTLDARTLPFHSFTMTLGATDLYRALNLTTTAQRLTNRPVFSTSLALEYTKASPTPGIAAFGLIALSMGARNAIPLPSAVDPTQYAAAYTIVNAYLRVRAAPRALVTLRVYNLADTHYSAIASPPFGGYPAPGRAFGVELSTR